MMDLQELITRGRHIFVSAPSRLDVFKNVNGKNSAKDIAGKLGRSINSVRNDLNAIRNVGLIQNKANNDGAVSKKDGYSLYEKIPLAKTVSLKYFESTSERPRSPDEVGNTGQVRNRARRQQSLSIPSASELLEICRHGECQLHEFKAQGTDLTKVSREIAAMLNTRTGGMVFYGVADDGTIEGSDLSRQTFDQRLQNSVRANIDPPPTVSVHQVTAMGSNIVVIIVPPWNRKDTHVFDGRALVRRGTNVFAAKAAELRKLHRGEFID